MRSSGVIFKNIFIRPLSTLNCKRLYLSPCCTISAFPISFSYESIQQTICAHLPVCNIDWNDHSGIEINVVDLANCRQIGNAPTLQVKLLSLLK
jgi:hypothetical protein